MGSDTILVREAEASDAETVGELLVESFVTTYGRKMPEVVVTEARKDDLRDVESKRVHERVFVAEKNGRIVGTVTVFRPHSPRSKTWILGASEIRYMAVDTEVQGSGVADLLISAAIEKALLWKAKLLTLHVRQGANGVIRFYERHGWVRDPAGDRDERPVIYLEAFARKLEKP